MTTTTIYKDEKASLTIHKCTLGDLYGFKKLLKGEIEKRSLRSDTHYFVLSTKFGNIAVTFFTDDIQDSTPEQNKGA